MHACASTTIFMKRDNSPGSRNCCAIWCSPVSFSETATVRPSFFKSLNARSDARKSLRNSRSTGVFLVQGFHRYRTPDLRRLPFLFLDRNCFPNLFDGYCLSNLWSGLCCLGSRRIYACRVARRRYPICGRSIVTILIFRGFRLRLRPRVWYHCSLDRIIWVMVSYKRGTFYGDRHDFSQVHSQLGARQIAGAKFPSDTSSRFAVDVAEFGGRLGLCRNFHVSATALDRIAVS